MEIPLRFADIATAVIIPVSPVAVLLLDELYRLHLHRRDGGVDNLHLIGEIVTRNRTVQRIGVAQRPRILGALRIFHIEGIIDAVPHKAAVLIDFAVFQRDNGLRRVVFVAIIFLRLNIPTAIVIKLQIGGPFAAEVLQIQHLIYLHRLNGGVDNLRLIGETVTCNRTGQLIGVPLFPRVLITLRVLIDKLVPRTVEVNRGTGVADFGTVFQLNGVGVGRTGVVEILCSLPFTLLILILFRTGLAGHVRNGIYLIHRNGLDRILLNRHVKGERKAGHQSLHGVGVTNRPGSLVALRIRPLYRLIIAVPPETFTIFLCAVGKDKGKGRRIKRILEVLFGHLGFVAVLIGILRIFTVKILYKRYRLPNLHPYNRALQFRQGKGIAANTGAIAPGVQEIGLPRHQRRTDAEIRPGIIVAISDLCAFGIIQVRLGIHVTACLKHIVACGFRREAVHQDLFLDVDGYRHRFAEDKLSLA